MLKICLCSDNHGNRTVIDKILSDNPACDYYLHAGDSEMEADDLKPFVSVTGNMDWYDDFPRKRVLEIGGHRILLIHGNGYTYSERIFVDKAKSENCDLVFYGHTHCYGDDTFFGIRFINPGSCRHNRDGSGPSYARVYLYDDGSVKAERVDL